MKNVNISLNSKVSTPNEHTWHHSSPNHQIIQKRHLVSLLSFDITILNLLSNIPFNKTRKIISNLKYDEGVMSIYSRILQTWRSFRKYPWSWLQNFAIQTCILEHVFMTQLDFVPALNYNSTSFNLQYIVN